MSEDRSTNTYGSTREKYMSCGAFILDQWIAGSQFDMKKNPDFVLGDKIKPDGYNYKIVGDRNTALELYLNGELDAVSLSPEIRSSSISMIPASRKPRPLRFRPLPSTMEIPTTTGFLEI